jgi:hypothetical protein
VMALVEGTDTIGFCLDGADPPDYDVTNISGTNNCVLAFKATF